MYKSHSLDNIKKEIILENPEFDFDFNVNLNLKKSQSPDLQTEKKIKIEVNKMATIEECRKTLPMSDGYTDFDKFIDLSEKYFSRLRHPNHRVDFALLILSKLTGKAYDVANSVDPQDWETIKAALIHSFRKTTSLTTLHTQ